VGRQDSQNTPEYGGVSGPENGNSQVGRAGVPPVEAPAAPRPPGATYGRASVPLNTANPQPYGGQRPEPQEPAQPSAADVAPEPPGVGKSRRTAVLSVLAALVLVVVAAAGVLVVRPGPVDRWLAADPTAAPTASATPDPTPTPVLAAATSGTAPTAAGVRAAITSLVGAPVLGSKVNVSVVDAATGGQLFEQNADLMITPASTTKLLTAATVLAARGPAYRLATRAVAGANPGEVVLVGGGDPTLAVNAKGQFPGAARLDKLADQVEKALGGRPPTKVLIDTSLYAGDTTAPGWDGDVIGGGQVARIQSLMTNAGRITPVHHEVGGDPRFSNPALSAGKAFAKQLGLPSNAVSAGKAPAAAPADQASPAATRSAGAATDPAPGTELGKVESPPLVHVVDWMLEQSDNVIAETMARQVALAAGKEASFAGAAEAMIAKLGELGLPADEATLADASGLSRRNGISPKLLTDLLTLAASGKHPELSGMFGGLPVAGWSGTLRTRFVTPTPNRIGQGLVRAKTGTLTGVNTIAGELVTKDGRLLVFAIMAGATGESAVARQALDKIVAKLVACGCP
jgi:D-alanyl-D-alanine carboxypeptidase/D-alanyl-D-alanine-endopeptidase (penicillin-binding protein 4)